MNTDGFESFWTAWPRNSDRYTRKGAKAQCLKVWTKNHNHTQAEQIVKHVEWLKTTADWLKDGGAFIPAPMVYLNQQRWDGADLPGETDWQETRGGVEQKAASLGLPKWDECVPWFDYKSKIVDAAGNVR